MRTALDDTGSPLEANVGLPDRAICPRCGGAVILRQRRRSRPHHGVTYFWRHQDHENAGCPARFEVNRNTKDKAQ